jgi:ADP-heptose:LPS heptosyltransferase
VLDTLPSANIIAIRDRRLAWFAIDFLRAIWTVRSKHVDTVIDMEFFSRASAIFTFLTAAPIRVGLHRFTGELPYRGDLMTHRVQYLPHLHISLQYSVLVEAAFHDPREVPMLKLPLPSRLANATGDQPISDAAPLPQFTPSALELQRMRERIGAGDAHPIVVLNPNASDLLPLRKWQTDKFKVLAQRILASYPSSVIVLTGAASERDAANALCREVGSTRVRSMAGDTTLPELLTLYTLADVLVTNDSGPGHFSSLTPVQAIVLFGPETPRLFGPLTPASTVIWKELACSPCVSVFNHRLSPCTNNICMQSITVDEVFEAVRSAVARSDLSLKSPSARTAT